MIEDIKECQKVYRQAVRDLIKDQKDKHSYIAILEWMVDTATIEVNMEMSKEFPDVSGYSWEVY